MAGQQAASPGTSHQDSASLKITPEWEPPFSVLPVGELKERLQLVVSIEKRNEYEALAKKDASEWKPFSNHRIASLMVMNLELLRSCARSDTATQVLADCLCQVPSLAKLLLIRPQAPDDVGAENPANTRQRRRSSDSSTETKCEKLGDSTENHTVGDTSTESDETQLGQERSAEQAIDHDSCIDLQTANPDICHILEVDASATERDSRIIHLTCGTEVSILRSSILFPDSPGFFTGYRLANKLFTSGDKKWDMTSLLGAWNTIPLSPQLHKWWSDLHFGFRCLGVVPAPSEGPGEGPSERKTTIKLQFHWMPRKLHTTTPLGRTEGAVLGSYNGNYGDVIPEKTVRSGDIFHLDVPTDHAEKTMLALDMRWSLVRIVALAGGIEALEMVPDTSHWLVEDDEHSDIVAYLLLD